MRKRIDSIHDLIPGEIYRLTPRLDKRGLITISTIIMVNSIESNNEFIRITVIPNNKYPYDTKDFFRNRGWVLRFTTYIFYK